MMRKVEPTKRMRRAANRAAAVMLTSLSQFSETERQRRIVAIEKSGSELGAKSSSVARPFIL
jgi:hypothetical protein